MVLPGFVTTFIFYWLADSPKPSQFERIIQALMGTAVIQFLVDLAESLLIWLGQWLVVGNWTESVASIWALSLAIGLGLLLAWLANNDYLYSLFRKFGLTTKPSHGSEWRYAHSSHKERWVVLHLKDERRIAGFPSAWPTSPSDGHYLLTSPQWIGEDGYVPVSGDAILISSSEVQWTEFLIEEVEESDDQGKSG